MKEKMRFMLGASVSVLVGVLPTGAHAQSAASMSAGQQVASPDGSSADTASARQQPVSASAIADIVVTAQKRAERINDVPLSITANSAPELKAAGVSSPDDLGKLVPGFVYAKSAYGVPVYTLRGIGFYDYGLAALPAVTVYVDEVPLPYGQLTAFSLLDVQRVETLKGPQGTLYGVGSTAGAINIIAASPTPSLAAGLDLTYARFNQVTVDGFISGPLTSTLQGRFAFHTENGGAWQRSYTRKDRLGDKRITSGRLLLDWAPTSAFSARLNVNAGIDRSDTQALQYEGPTTLPSTNATLLRLNPSLYNYPRAPENNRAADWDVNYPFRSDNHNFQAALTANYDINADLTLKSITSFNRFTTTSSVDGDGTNQQDATILVDGKIRVFFQELRLSGTYDNGLRWIIGANFQDDKVDQRQDGFLTRSTQGLPVPGATHNASFSFQNAQSKAVYANVEFSVVDGLTAQGGVRYTKSDRDLKGCSTAQDQNTANFFGPRVGAVIPVGGCYTRRPDGTVGFYTTSLNQDNVSWRAGLDWKVNRDVMLYANVSHGYKQGGFPIVGASSYLSLQPAVQEDVLAYETGAKLTLLDGAVQFNTAAFYNDYTNKQVRGRVIDPATNAQASALVNVPKSKIYGGELQLTLRPVQQLTLNADATYIKTKITSSFLNFDFIAQRVQMKGQVLPFSPKLTFNVRADYQPPINSDWNAVFGVAVKHQSSSFGGLGELAVARNKAFTTLDLRAGVKSADDRWNVSVFGRNVTNTYYWTAPALIIDTLGRYAGAPATYGVTVSFRY